MHRSDDSVVPGPVVCAGCGSAWPRLWVARREITRCPYCRAELTTEQTATTSVQTAPAGAATSA